MSRLTTASILLTQFFFPNIVMAAGGAVLCTTDNNPPFCVAALRYQTTDAARYHASELCDVIFHIRCNLFFPVAPTDECVAITFSEHQTTGLQPGRSINEAARNALADCKKSFSNNAKCAPIYSYCETSTYTSENSDFGPSDGLILESSLNTFSFISDFTLFDIAALRSGISFGIGLFFVFIIAIVVYVKRASITNFTIHGNLPLKPIYPADRIEVLFKHSQRFDWFGRVVFAITAQAGMSAKELTLIRKYWLGRVIAFDSLRRQKHNALAKLHLQLALQTDPKPKDDKPLFQLLAALRYFFFVIFWLLRALFSFLFSFFGIRVTIAKLARGAYIESRDLVLLLQAKEAIRDSIRYLQEYLALAETFDGREEVFQGDNLHEPR